MADNKIKFGLKNAYYALLTDAATPTWDTPVAIPGAVSLSLDPDGDLIKFFADDTALVTVASNNGYNASLEVAILTPAAKADLFNWSVDALGGLVEDADAQPAPFALMFEVQGDAAAYRAVLYNCTASRSKQDNKTKGEKVEVATDTLNVVAMPLDIDGTRIPLYVLPSTASNGTEFDAFFTAVTTPGAAVS